MRNPDTFAMRVSETPAEAGAEPLFDGIPPRRVHQALCRLLDADPDLGVGVGAEALHEARHRLTVSTFAVVKREEHLIDRWLRSSVFGLLLLDGYVVSSVSLGGRSASEILGPGDLLQPGVEEAFGMLTSVARRAIRTALFAVLDRDFAEAVARWPSITRNLQQRAAQRAGRLAVLRLLLFHPRVEVRLALLFDHFAQRWGKVTPHGVRVPVPLTHDLLAHLTGAARPSVSAALARLCDDGLLERDRAGWRVMIGSEELNEYVGMRTPGSDRRSEPVPQTGL